MWVHFILFPDDLCLPKALTGGAYSWRTHTTLLLHPLWLLAIQGNQSDHTRHLIKSMQIYRFYTECVFLCFGHEGAGWSRIQGYKGEVTRRNTSTDKTLSILNGYLLCELLVQNIWQNHRHLQVSLGLLLLWLGAALHNYQLQVTLVWERNHIGIIHAYNMLQHVMYSQLITQTTEQHLIRMLV